MQETRIACLSKELATTGTFQEAGALNKAYCTDEKPDPAVGGFARCNMFTSE